jgi:tRNA pseudouridine38-40 synthase
VEDALGRYLGEVPELSAAGRTDAGVHAEGQVISFRSEEDPVGIQRALNGMLGPEVAVVRATRAAEGFDARRSATAREYRYRVRLAEPPDPFTARYVWHRPKEVRVGEMRRAARLLEGEHDFSSFSRRRPGVKPVRRLEKLTVRRDGDELIIGARANGFLHQMVRSLVGTLIRVGDGKVEPEKMTEVLEAHSRAAAGQMAPPHGLSLVRVEYGVRGAER